MFKYDLKEGQEPVQITLDNKITTLPGGMTVAAALLSIGEISSRRSPSSGRMCSPHCLMGVCYECLMEIDGINRQACMTEIKEGMVINRYLDADGLSRSSVAADKKGTSHESI